MPDASCFRAAAAGAPHTAALHSKIWPPLWIARPGVGTQLLPSNCRQYCTLEWAPGAIASMEPYKLFRTRCLFVGRRVSMNDNPEPIPTPLEAFHQSPEPDPGNLQSACFFGR